MVVHSLGRKGWLFQKGFATITMMNNVMDDRICTSDTVRPDDVTQALQSRGNQLNLPTCTPRCLAWNPNKVAMPSMAREQSWCRPVVHSVLVTEHEVSALTAGLSTMAWDTAVTRTGRPAHKA